MRFSVVSTICSFLLVNAHLASSKDSHYGVEEPLLQSSAEEKAGVLIGFDGKASVKRCAETASFDVSLSITNASYDVMTEAFTIVDNKISAYFDEQPTIEWTANAKRESGGPEDKHEGNRDFSTRRSYYVELASAGQIQDITRHLAAISPAIRVTWIDWGLSPSTKSEAKLDAMVEATVDAISMADKYAARMGYSTVRLVVANQETFCVQDNGRVVWYDNDAVIVAEPLIMQATIIMKYTFRIS